MKTRSVAMTLSAAAVLILCCRKDDTVSPQEEAYIPLITNSWTEVADPNHTFSFQAQRESVQTGTFTGSETTPANVTYDTLSGTFSNRNISFTVTRLGIPTTYSGRFTSDTLIDFGTLKLFRQ
jgi:hypothetical protein